jgi:hypothetical protein
VIRAADLPPDHEITRIVPTCRSYMTSRLPSRPATPRRGSFVGTEACRRHASAVREGDHRELRADVEDPRGGRSRTAGFGRTGDGSSCRSGLGLGARGHDRHQGMHHPLLLQARVREDLVGRARSGQMSPPRLTPSPGAPSRRAGSTGAPAPTRVRTAPFSTRATPTSWSSPAKVSTSTTARSTASRSCTGPSLCTSRGPHSQPVVR